MTIMNAMFSGSSALTNYGNAMSVIGNNLANSNTVAFKKSDVSFQDILSQTVGSTVAQGTNQVGNGVSLSSIDQRMEQGAFEYTGGVTDLAIDGDGFFVVKDYSNSTEGASYYTRAGNFARDKDGYLVTGGGMRLQGVQLTTAGDPIGSSQDITLGSVKSSSQPTSVAKISVNLDSAADIPSGTYDPTDPSTYNYSSSVRVYDSLGNGHVVEVHFRKVADNTWEWHPVLTSTDLISTKRSTTSLTAVDLQNPTDVATALTGADYGDGTNNSIGQLKFTTSGALMYEGSTPITFYWSEGAEPQQILFDFGDALGASDTDNADSTDDYTDFQRDDPNAADYLTFVGTTAKAEDKFQTGSDGTVQFAAGFATLRLSQDGFPAGYLERINVDPNGKLFGSFSNGQVKPLYQLQLASFPNTPALDMVGKNLFAETWTSGQPLKGYPKTGSFGGVVANSLEQSNVDLSDEFVQMISVQRAFQANSRIVSVTDGMLEELINLKR